MIYSTHRACIIRSDKHRKGHLIGIDNGQLTSNEKMGGLINRGRGSYIMHSRDYIHCSVASKRITCIMYVYRVAGVPFRTAIRHNI